MSNGTDQACCVLCICCGDDKAMMALTKALETAGLNTTEAANAAAYVLAHWDLGPKGLVQPLLQAAFDMGAHHH